MATTLTSSYQLICSKSTSTYSTLRLYGKLNSQDTTNNTSSISLQARLYGNGGSGSFSSGSIKITATSGSSTTNLGSTSYSKGSEKTLKTWTTTVSHAADGSYTNKSVSAVLTSTSSPNGTASGTITVKTIPRQNTISAPTQADIGSTINIVIGKNSDSFRNTVTWTYNGSTQTIFDKVASGTYQWTVPTSIYSTIPNSQEATITLTNKTYSGSTQIGSDTTATLKVKVSNSSRPTLSLNSKVETNSVVTAQLPSSANDFTRPIINLSKPRFTFTATAKDSATLTLLTVTNGNNTRTVNLSGTSQSVTYTFQNPMTNPIITFDVTDSRGLTMSTPYTFDGTSQQFVYTNPIFKTVVIKRPNVTQSTVRAEITGVYTPKQLNGSTDNKIWVGFDSREVDGSYSGNIEWYESGVSSNITLDTTNGTWSFNGNLVNKTAAYDKSYYFKVYLKDNVTEQQEFVYMLAKSVPTMSLGENDMQVNGELVVDSLRSKNMLNLINFASLTANGVTFTNNGDGTITINGTATQDFGVRFTQFKIKSGNYYLSINESATLPSPFYLYDYDTGTGHGSGAITLSRDYEQMGFDTWVTAGNSFNNITIAPQLETGSAGTSFAPYQNLDNIILELYNDTSGSNWQEMMKNKLDFCISNCNTTKENAETFVNGGWYGRNFGFGIFSKTGNTYQLVWFSSENIYYCRNMAGTYDYRNLSWTGS